MNRPNSYNRIDTAERKQGEILDAMLDCKHPATRFGVECIVCGAVVPDARLRGLARAAAAAQKDWYAGKVALWRVKRDVIFEELAALGRDL